MTCLMHLVIYTRKKRDRDRDRDRDRGRQNQDKFETETGRHGGETEAGMVLVIVEALIVRKDVFVTLRREKISELS